MVSAGRVLIIPKGAYNPATTYEMLDLVSYNGSSYIAKTTTTGNLPTDTTYWQLSAYGGQAANIAGNFAEIETSSIATSVHYEKDIFVDENSQLMKATQTINIGDTIDENTNCTPTTVEALISYLSSYVDSLDSLNKKIQGAIEIAAQTDLHSLAIGEYYKKQSTFYITNGPTGIDQDPTAIFRLTVEAALDNASQASSPLLLTLRTPDGKIYTQGFDGTIWGSWKQIADKSSLDVIEARVDAVEDSVADVDTRVNSVESSVADVETSSTASKAYAIGESFYYNDVLYKVTAAISQGGTITPGTNCTPEKIIEKIDDLVSENQTLTNNKLTKILITSVDDMPASKDFYDFEDGSYYLGAGVVHGTGVVNAPPITNGCSMYVNTNGVYKVFSVYPYSFANAEQEPMYIACASSSANMKWTGAVTQNQITNPNLLDNPWFTVNQRSASTYGATNENAWKYTVDRWQKYDGATGNTQIDVSDSGIAMTNSSNVEDGVLAQNIDEPLLYGKKVILSAIIDGVLYIADGTVPSAKTTGWQQIALVESSSGVRIYAFLVPSTITAFNIQIAIRTPKDGNAYTIRAVKLEIGSVSTLASDTSPNYQQELAKCQRYFQIFGKGGNEPLGIGQAKTTTDCSLIVPLSVPMRTKPTATLDISATNAYVHLRNGITLANITNIRADIISPSSIMLVASSTNLTVGAVYEAFCMTGGTVSLSADL